MPQKARQLNQAPDIQYNQTSVKLVDYIVKRDMTKWSIHPDSQFQQEEKEKEKSMVRTDQGEYVTGVHQVYAIPTWLLFYSYESDIPKEDPTFTKKKKKLV